MREKKVDFCTIQKCKNCDNFELQVGNLILKLNEKSLVSFYEDVEPIYSELYQKSLFDKTILINLPLDFMLIQLNYSELNILINKLEEFVIKLKIEALFEA